MVFPGVAAVEGASGCFTYRSALILDHGLLYCYSTNITFVWTPLHSLREMVAGAVLLMAIGYRNPLLSPCHELAQDAPFRIHTEWDSCAWRQGPARPFQGADQEVAQNVLTTCQ